jgi:hypothetical protein
VRVVPCARDASSAGCPQRSVGTQTPGSPFLGLLSFGETKETDCAAGRMSPAPEHCDHAVMRVATDLTQAAADIADRALTRRPTPAAAQRSEAGSRPRRRLPFLVSPRKGSKRRRPRSPRPQPPSASGATCGARGRGASHNSHHSLRSFTSNRCDESVNDARDARAPPLPLRSSARGQGWGRARDRELHGPSLRSALRLMASLESLGRA